MYLWWPELHEFWFRFCSGGCLYYSLIICGNAVLGTAGHVEIINYYTVRMHPLKCILYGMSKYTETLVFFNFKFISNKDGVFYSPRIFDIPVGRLWACLYYTGN